MTILDKLYVFQFVPKVNKFLCCISKRLGCTIIGVAYLFLSFEALVSIVSSTKIKCYITGIVQQIISCVAFVIWVITLLTTVLFLYGITKNHPIFLIIFMYTTVLLIMYNTIHSFMMFFYFYKEHSCPTPYLFGGANFFGAVVLIYFLVIVNSFYKQTVEKQTLNIANVGVVFKPSKASRVSPSATPAQPSKSS